VSVKRITRMGRHLRRAERAKRGRPRRSERRKQRATAFGYQLAMLAAGAPLVDVIASACGASDAGRMHAERWRVLLAEIPQKAHRRRVFEHYLRTFNGARLHGSQWRVVDAEGYVGQRYAMGWREDVDDSTGEVTKRWGRVHMPAKSAGGLAAQQQSPRTDGGNISPRSCDRYRELMRAGKLIGSEQPNGEKADDAYWPARDDAQYPYGQLWLTLPPSPEMIAAWLANPPPVHPKRPAPKRNEARKARRARPAPFELAEADIPF